MILSLLADAGNPQSFFSPVWDSSATPGMEYFFGSLQSAYIIHFEGMWKIPCSETSWLTQDDLV